MNTIDCFTCVYTEVKADDEPCCHCYFASHANPATEWVNNATDKDAPYNDCNTCRYEEVEAKEDPCYNCVGGSEWQFDTFPDEPGDCPFGGTEDAPESDSVDHPGHYTSLPLEAIQTIRLVLTEVYGPEGFEAYCFGNELKYRLRAGFKGDALEDIGKALRYEQFRKNNFE